MRLRRLLPLLILAAAGTSSAQQPAAQVPDVAPQLWGTASSTN
jgi:hypothetical protein